MTVTLKPGMLGVDYSGARPTMGAVKAGRGEGMRGRFIMRYSAGAHGGDPSVQWKLCGPNEIRDAVAAGLDFLALSELWETRLAEGAGAGHDDGVADLAFWKSRGLAKGAAIITCYDTGPTSAVYPAIEAYLRAYGQALGGYYRVGLYAGDAVLRHMRAAGVIAMGVQPNATSWSNYNLPYAPSNPHAYLDDALAKSSANIWQTGTYWFGKNADEDMVIRTPVWSHLDALRGGAADPQESDPLADLTDKQLDQIARAVWQHQYKRPSDGEHQSMQAYLGHADLAGKWAMDAARKAGDDVGKKVDAVRKVLTAEGSGVLDRVTALQRAVNGVGKGVDALSSAVDAVGKAVAAIKPGVADVDVAKVITGVSAAVKSITWKAGE